MRARILRFGSVVAAVLAGTIPALAGDPSPGIPNVEALGKELVALAVIVLVVESALATIFQWRLYRMLFNSRAVKTIVMIVVGGLIVKAFNYDVFTRIVKFVDPQLNIADWGSFVSLPLSALIIAGGSAGVNAIFQRLGIRNPVQPETERPLLNGDQAWISVRVLGLGILGPVQVSVLEVADDLNTPALAGTVAQLSFVERFKAAFSVDAMRFPNYGGRTITAGKTYRIVVIGRSRNAAGMQDFSREVYYGRFASRAVVDLQVTID